MRGDRWKRYEEEELVSVTYGMQMEMEMLLICVRMGDSKALIGGRQDRDCETHENRC